MRMFSIRSVWRGLQLWGDSPVRWLTATIFHTAATVTISLAAPTYSSMQMGHRDLRRGFRRGRVKEIEMREESLSTEGVCLRADMNTQQKQISF